MAYSTDVTLVASTTSTANVTASTGDSVTVDTYRRGSFVLTATVNSGSPTLDVAIQAYIGSTWTDIARFAQVTATSTRFLWDVGGTVGTSSTIEEAQQTLGITVSTKRAGPWGTAIRAIYTIASAGSITWSVKGTVQS